MPFRGNGFKRCLGMPLKFGNLNILFYLVLGLSNEKLSFLKYKTGVQCDMKQH